MGGFERKRDAPTTDKDRLLRRKPVVDVSDTLLSSGAEPAKPSMTTHQAKSVGFTGDPCPQCGSMRMVHTGHCNTCQECGSTTGCS